jgi:hypothetical protein
VNWDCDFDEWSRVYIFMLGVVLGLAIAVQGEPKLEWATFGDFSARLNEGSGYRLVMDKSISDRPVVWYFSKPGESGFELLRRSCKELCLNFEIDEPLKKVFIIGPNADAGPTLQSKIERAIADSKEFVQHHWNDADSVLKIIEEGQGDDNSELAKDLARQLRDGRSRTLLSGVLGMDARSLAVALAKKPSGSGVIPVSTQMVKGMDDYFSKNLNSPDSTLVFKAKQYFEFKNGKATYSVQHYCTDSGEFGMSLKMASDDALISLGFASCFIKNKVTAVGVSDTKNSEVLNTVVNVDRVQNELFETVNWYQTIAIEKKWNTVSWFDPTSGVLISGCPTLQTRNLNGPTSHARFSDDQWLTVFTGDSIWKSNSGDWSGPIQSTGVLNLKSSWMDVLKYLNSLTDAQIDGMAQIDEAGIGKGVMDDVMRDGWLIRAGLRELAVEKTHDVMVYGNTVGSGAGGDLSRFWRVTQDPILLRPTMVSRRNYAVLNCYEQVKAANEGKMDFYVVFNLMVPNGVDDSTGQFLYYEKKVELLFKEDIGGDGVLN